jgi:Plasmid pRiA4b ORF-3-like protein
VSDDKRSVEELLRQFQGAISGMNPADLRELAGYLPQLAERTPPYTGRPSLRRRPLAHTVIYRLRVDLHDAHPPIWRRLEIRSDVTLDVVHQVLQAAFGWADYHLHRFSLGGGPFDQQSEFFLCPFDVEDGDESGVAASAVRLDETLQEPGDVLRYVYDYGDNWELTLRLEEVLPASESVIAVCIAGRRAAPPEDCGGITNAEDLAQVLDDPAQFDLDEVNQALRAPYFILREARVHPRLVELVNRLAFTEIGADLVTRTYSLTSPAPQPTQEEMVTALGAYFWFLDRAGEGGIELTSAGYLKPADVEAACAVVPAMGDWISKKNRELNCVPLLDFRESLQAMGLLRKYKGQLLLTRAAANLGHDPAKLWEFLAGRLVPTKTDAFTEEAALLVLLYAATSTDGRVSLGKITEALRQLGWRRSDQQPLETYELYGLERSPLDVLTNVSDEPVSFKDRDRLSPVAIALARAALRLGP